MILFVFYIFIPLKTYAIEYQEVSREKLTYDFNNFYIENDYVVLNGWAVTGGEQHLIDNSTHDYYLDVIDKNNNITKTYQAILKNVNKTELMRFKTTYTMCSYDTYYASDEDCYYRFENVGFEFHIPLSDLKNDKEYSLKFKIHQKLINVGYQTDVYALGINSAYSVNGIKYQLYSDISTTKVSTYAETLMIRTEASSSAPQQRGNISCGSSGTRLYWKKDEVYNHILEVIKTNGNNIDSETWLRISFNEGICSNNRNRVYDGSSNSGFAAFIWFNTSGQPATIRTSTINNTKIKQMKTYTSKSGSNARATISLYNNIEQSLLLKIYHGNQIVYEENIQAFIGEKMLDVGYITTSSDVFKVEITEESGYVVTQSSTMYVSSEEEIDLSIVQNDDIIISTPILVEVDEEGITTNYYEKIKFISDIQNNKIERGRFISGLNVKFIYYNNSSEIDLNSNYSISALLPTKEDTLNYEIYKGYYRIPLIESGLSENEYTFPNFYVHKNGEVYSTEQSQSTLIENAWFPRFNDNTGKYQFYILGENIGINLISIKVPLDYEIVNNSLYSNNNLFIINRVENPSNPLYFYSKKFTYNELLNDVEK